MNKPWLGAYPAGMPSAIDSSAYRSLATVIAESFDRFAERPAYTNMDVTLSFADLDRHSRALAAYLQQVLGLRRGDRVAIMMPNLLQYPVAVFAVLRAGLTVVNVNPLYTGRELSHQLNDSGAETIIILENFAHVLAGVRAETPVKNVLVARVGDMLPTLKGALVNLVVKRVKKMVPAWRIDGHIRFKQALAEGSQRTLQPLDLNHDDVAFLQYTGGTTGVSKGATLTHGNMLANLLQMVAWMHDSLQDGRETVITALPLYHIFSLTVNCLLFLQLGGHSVLITNPRDMPGFVKELGKRPFSVITGVNTLFNGLLNTPGFERLDFAPLKLAIGGGAAIQKAVAERWKSVTGKTLIEGYGLTESAPVACCNLISVSDHTGGIGFPLPSTDVEIRDGDDRPLPSGQPGELCVRGPQVMRGYWNRPDETAQTLRNGWLHSGDVAVMDENGFCRIVDRQKDMILVSGFNVYPNEIEEVLVQHPSVLEAAAIGVADEKSGEAVRAFVVCKSDDGGAPSADELIRHCRENLTSYKCPRQIVFRDELPKTPIGKILRRELRDE